MSDAETWWTENAEALTELLRHTASASSPSGDTLAIDLAGRRD